MSVSEVRHLENGTSVDGPHPEHANYESFADFTDPDGNIWILQEVDRSKGQAWSRTDQTVSVGQTVRGCDRG